MEASSLTERVPFGKTQLRVSRVGLGSWAIGGMFSRFGWGPQDDADSVATIHRAVELGVNWIDTAPIYGLGHSEEIVGRAVRELPAAERPYIFTKCGLRWGADTEPIRVGAEDSLREEVDASLRRLGVERIDLYQMHWPAQDGTPLADYWSVLLDLVAEGKVGAVGLSNHDVTQAVEANALGRVSSMQPPLSLIRREALAEVIPWCRANDVAVVNYAPMQNGLLTGAFTEQLAADLGIHDDWRGRTPEFQGAGLRQNLALAQALAPIAKRHGTDIPAIAIAWCLSVPGVTATIVGARQPGEVDGWIDAPRLILTDADLDEIAAAVESTGAGGGPVRPGEAP